MKRYNNLFDKIVTLENLELADRKARKNKQQEAIQRFDKHRAENLLKLQQQLLDGTYKTSNYTTFIIREPKEREIFRLPYYPDRIVHHAIMNIMEPIWVSTMIKQTYSCIKKRGIHKALKDVRKALRDRCGTRYCLKLDIRKFYPSIDHDILKQIIRKKIKDICLLSLLDEIIDSAKGVPIGNYLSQFFANMYLTYFDHWVKEILKVRYYYRYADDIVILSSSKEDLRNIFDKVKKYIESIKLQIKDNWQIFDVESRGISFVGYIIRHDYTRLRKNIKQNACRKSIKLSKKKDMTESYYLQQMSSYIGWAMHCNGKNLMKKILLYKRLMIYLY